MNKSLGSVLAHGVADLFSVKQTVVENIAPADASFWTNWFGASNWSGKNVNSRTTLQLSTAMACVRKISETMSTLPFGLFEKGVDGHSVPAVDHQLYYLLHTRPNLQMTASVFWQAFIASLLLHGNAYVEKKRNANGLITSLVFLVPERISSRLTSSGVPEWSYVDAVTNRPRIIQSSELWHMPAFTLDGITGISPIQYGANVFAGAMATDQASAETFRNAMKSPGLVTMDALLNPKQREDIREHVKKVSGSGGVMVLEKGSGFQALAMNPQDAELLASRAYAIEEICRWFGIDPSLVGHGSKDSNWGTGLEEKMGWFITFCLRPLSVRIEQSVKKDLMTPLEAQRYSGEFALEGLLRGSSSARAAYYGQMVNNGIMTRDECRRLENLPPMGNNAGVLTIQSAMQPIDSLGKEDPGTQVHSVLKSWLGLDPPQLAT